MLQAFCDASGIFGHRFQSIGVVSGNMAALDELRASAASLIKRSGIRELKFVNMTRFESPDYRATVSTITLTISEYCRLGKARLDVMTWDTADSRHAIRGRNDIENLARLYYHLLLSVIKRWPIGSWVVVVDRDEKVNFNVLRDCLNNCSKIQGPAHLPGIIESTSQLADLDTIKNITDADSEAEPLIQVADLFAGIGRFSREAGDECCHWLGTIGNPDQLPLPDLTEGEEGTKDYSRSKECRYRLIGEVNRVCKKYRLGVSLETKKRLWTPFPANPVNFWSYKPQGDYDRAPTA
jgi:hypothetical protein